MEKISSVLLTFLLNATWQLALVAGVASLASRLLRHAPARYRHFLWVSALLFGIALPMMDYVQLAPVRAMAKRPAPVLTTAPVSNVATDAAAMPLSDVSSPLEQPVRARRDLAIPAKLADGIVALYLAFVLFRLAGLVRAWMLTRTIVQHAVPAQFSAILERVTAHCRQQTGVENVRFLCSASVAAPLTVRSAPAVVVLPEKLLGEPDEVILTCAIGHELVHVQRYDYLLNVFYRLLSIPLSFHPAATLIQRRIDQTRELRCDEVVTDRLLSPTAYARSLVELAGAAHAFRRPATLAVGIADADILEERIMYMLKKRRISFAQRVALLATAALLLAVPCIAAAPYAMHLKVATPAAVSNAEPTAAAAQATPPQSAQVTSDVGDGSGLRAGQAYAKRTSSDATQEQRVKAEAQVNVGFAYQSGETQSQEEGIARKKLEMKRRMEEENLSPEQREAHRKMEYAEMAARTRRLAELSKAAKITMQQAIDAALRQQNGTVMESSLIGERTFTVKTAEGEVTTGSLNDGGLAKAMYRIVILFGDENSPQRAIVLVNAIDGTILRSVVE